jgi:hypothetical protein
MLDGKAAGGHAFIRARRRIGRDEPDAIQIDVQFIGGDLFDHAALDGMLQAVEKDASSRTFVNFVVISTDSGFVTSTDSSMLWTRPQNVASDGRTPLPQTADCRPRS